MVARLQKFSWIDTFEDGRRMLEVIATRVTRVEAIEAFQRWLPTIEVTGALLCFRVHTLAHPLYCGGGVVARLFAQPPAHTSPRIPDAPVTCCIDIINTIISHIAHDLGFDCLHCLPFVVGEVKPFNGAGQSVRNPKVLSVDSVVDS